MTNDEIQRTNEVLMKNFQWLKNSSQEFLEFAINWPATTPFPLTPALSLGEKENRFPVLRQSAAPLCFKSGITCLPLPEGEGRGEGEKFFGTTVKFENIR
jgi:hypothetical protein